MLAAGYLVFQNLFLANAWWVVQVRNIDDFAFQTSVAQFADRLSSGEYAAALETFDYAYGFIFWVTSWVLTAPGRISSSIPLTVFAGRVGSVVSIIFCGYLVGKISRNVYGVSQAISNTISLVVILFPVHILLAGRLQPTTYSVALTLLGLHLLTSATVLNRRRIMTAGIVLGLAIGFKFTALTIIPVYVAVIAVRSRQSFIKASLFLLISAIITGAVASAPSLLNPKQTIGTIGQIQTQVAAVSFPSVAERQVDFYTYSSGVLGGYGQHILVWICIFGLTAISLQGAIWSKVNLRVAVSGAVAACACFGLVALYLLQGHRSVIYSTIYLDHIFVLIPPGILGIVRCTTDRPWCTQLAALLIVAISATSTAVRVELSNSNYYGFVRSAEYEEMKTTITALENALHRLNSHEEVTVVQDYRAVFPYTNLDKKYNYKIFYSFDNFELVALWHASPVRLLIVAGGTREDFFAPESQTYQTVSQLRDNGLFLDEPYSLFFVSETVEVYVLDD